MLILLALASIPIVFILGVCFGLCLAISWLSRKRSQRFLSRVQDSNKVLKSKHELYDVIVDSGTPQKEKKKKTKKKKQEYPDYNEQYGHNKAQFGDSSLGNAPLTGPNNMLRVASTTRWR